MKKDRGPTLGPFMPKVLSRNMQTSLVAVYSGEITADKYGVPITSVTAPGRITGVWLTTKERGIDASHTLSIEADVQINGTSCLTTKPKISKTVSGETANTYASGEGIVQAVIDTDNNLVDLGDLITADFNLTRTSSPTTEVKSAVVTLDIEPLF